MKEFKDLMVRLWKEEDGLTTVEIVIVIAVLVTVALIFKQGIQQFIQKLMRDFFQVEKPETPTFNLEEE